MHGSTTGEPPPHFLEVVWTSEGCKEVLILLAISNMIHLREEYAAVLSTCRALLSPG